MAGRHDHVLARQVTSGANVDLRRHLEDWMQDLVLLVMFPRQRSG